MCEIFFLLRSYNIIESFAVSCFVKLWKAIIFIYFVHFLSLEGSCDKQNLKFVVI